MPQEQLRVEQYIQSRDGKYEIYHHMWKEFGELKGVVFIVHGLGEHCHRYDGIIGFLTRKGIRIYSFDHRGHGRTFHFQKGNTKQGHKGHIDADANVIMDDINQLVDRAKQDGIADKIPKFLIGHSLGGLMTIYYAMTRKITGLSGLIFIAPAIGIHRPPNIFIRTFGPIVADLLPTYTIEGDIRLHELSRIPEVLEIIKSDSMMHRKLSLGTGKVVLAMCELLEKEKEPEIDLPTLFIHGTADKITDPLATESFYNKLKCPLKRLYLHQDGFHRSHEDVGSELVFEELEDFIKEISSAQ